MERARIESDFWRAAQISTKHQGSDQKLLGKYISDAVLNILTNLQWVWKWVNDFFDVQILLPAIQPFWKSYWRIYSSKGGQNQDTADHSLWVKQPRDSFINEVLLEHNCAFSSQSENSCFSTLWWLFPETTMPADPQTLSVWPLVKVPWKNQHKLRKQD